MQVAIYTLGVCLLEIRLWQSFVICDKEDGIPQSGNGNDLLGALAIKEETKRAFCVKELFIAARGCPSWLDRSTATWLSLVLVA